MRGAWLLLLLVGCGYTVQTDRSEAPLPNGSLPRVAVAPFDNLTYRRGLEMRLSRLLADEIRGRSPHPPFRTDEAVHVPSGRITRSPFPRVSPRARRSGSPAREAKVLAGDLPVISFSKSGYAHTRSSRWTGTTSRRS